jgi:hypothetical protein
MQMGERKDERFEAESAGHDQNPINKGFKSARDQAEDWD